VRAGTLQEAAAQRLQAAKQGAPVEEPPALSSRRGSKRSRRLAASDDEDEDGGGKRGGWGGRGMASGTQIAASAWWPATMGARLTIVRG